MPDADLKLYLLCDCNLKLNCGSTASPNQRYILGAFVVCSATIKKLLVISATEIPQLNPSMRASLIFDN